MLHGSLSPSRLNTANSKGNVMFLIDTERGERQNDLLSVKVNGNGSVYVWNPTGTEMLPLAECPGVNQKGSWEKPWFLCRIHCITHLWHAHPLFCLLSLLLCGSELPCSPGLMVWQRYHCGKFWVLLAFPDWWRSSPWQHRESLPCCTPGLVPRGLYRLKRASHVKKWVLPPRTRYLWEFVVTHTDNQGDCAWKLLWWYFCDQC